MQLVVVGITSKAALRTPPEHRRRRWHIQFNGMESHRSVFEKNSRGEVRNGAIIVQEKGGLGWFESGRGAAEKNAPGFGLPHLR